MNLIELERALRQLRLGGIAAVLETRLRQAQTEAMAPIDLIPCLVADELSRRCDRLLDRRRKQAAFRDPHKTLDNFDFTFNPKMNRSLVFDLATCAFIAKREDALFLGPGGTGKSHLAQAIGQARLRLSPTSSGKGASAQPRSFSNNAKVIMDGARRIKEKQLARTDAQTYLPSPTCSGKNTFGPVYGELPNRPELRWPVRYC